MYLWTYRFTPVIDGHEVPVALETSWAWSRLVVHPPGAGATPVSDRQDYFKDPYRLHEVALDGPGGALRFVVGPRTAWSYGLKVIRADQTLWQSHDSPHAYLGKMQDMMTSRQDGKPVFEGSSFKRNATAA